jgi:hypothetical protein
MKKNHEDVISYIYKAIQLCGSDNVFSETKKYLSLAVNSANKVSKRRATKETQREHYENLAKKKYEEWWKMIKENAKKNFDAKKNLEDE